MLAESSLAGKIGVCFCNNSATFELAGNAGVSEIEDGKVGIEAFSIVTVGDDPGLLFKLFFLGFKSEGWILGSFKSEFCSKNTRCTPGATLKKTQDQDDTRLRGL